MKNKVILVVYLFAMLLLVGQAFSQSELIGQSYFVPNTPFIDDGHTLSLYHIDDATKIQGPAAPVADDTSITARTAYNSTAGPGVMIVTGGLWGNAGQFDTPEGDGEIITDNQIACPNTTDWTLEGWVKPTSYRALDWYFGVGGINGENDWIRGGTDPEYAAGLWGYEFGPQALQLSLNTWHHIALMYQASSGWGFLAVDGTIVDGRIVNTLDDPRQNQLFRVHIGGWDWGFSSQMNGYVDEVRFSNVMRYPTQVIGTVTNLNNPMQVLQSDPSGSKVHFNVVLNHAPQSGDTVTITPDPNAAGNIKVSVTPSSLVFTSSNWNVAQTFTVTAVHDPQPWVANPEYTLVGLNAVSAYSDSTFANGIFTGAPQGVRIMYINNDIGSVALSKSAATVWEGGTGDSYTVLLARQPTASVTVNIGAINPPNPDVPEPLTHLLVNGSTTAQLVFTTGNYNVPQTVNITVPANAVVEGDPYYETITNISTSADSTYLHLIGNVQTTIHDTTCGGWGYLPMDLNNDCKVDFKDFALFAQKWLVCTTPYATGCVDAR